MYNSDTEVLFPSRVIPLLRTLHGEEWSKLIDHIHSPEATPAERHAFVLMIEQYRQIKKEVDAYLLKNNGESSPDKK